MKKKTKKKAVDYMLPDHMLFIRSEYNHAIFGSFLNSKTIHDPFNSKCICQPVAKCTTLYHKSDKEIRKALKVKKIRRVRHG